MNLPSYEEIDHEPTLALKKLIMNLPSSADIDQEPT